MARVERMLEIVTPIFTASLRAERLPLDQVPVVDFRPFLDGDPAQRKRAALELAGAFRNMGFAYLAGHGPNQWPAGAPEFRQAMEDYQGAVHRLAGQVTAAVAVALELPEDYFAAWSPPPW